MTLRLQKHIRDILGISRRKADDLIAEGKVEVNGAKAVLGQVVDPSCDTVMVDGKELRGVKSVAYIVMNKPYGYLTTRYDPHSPDTIYNLLPESMRSLFPVGRLDRDTEGLLILTNDGDLAYKLTHPKFEVEKEYYVVINGSLKPQEKAEIEKGIKTPDIDTSNAKLRVVLTTPSETQLYLTIHEGQKREIRRIFAHFGYNVKFLKRVRLKDLTLDKLQKGEWRTLTAEELRRLRS